MCTILSVYPILAVSNRQRPYHVENTGSRPITEVKQHRARSVLGWVTAWEHRVPLSFYLFYFYLFFIFPSPIYYLIFDSQKIMRVLYNGWTNL